MHNIRNLNLWKRRLKKIDKRFGVRLFRRLCSKYHFYAGKSVVRCVPEYLQIDVTNHCNLKCKMCPQSLKQGMRRKGFMDLGLAKKIIDDGSKLGIITLIIGIHGEPLLHKELLTIIEYAKRRDFYVQMSTNCTLLTPEVSRKLIQSGLDEIILSFDTVKSELYERYRRGARFDQTLANIRGFLKLKKELKHSYLLVVMQNLQPYNPSKSIQVENDFREKFEKYDVMIIAKYFYNQAGLHNEFKNPIFKKRIKKRTKFNKTPCYQVYQRFLVSWDGYVLACCDDFKGWYYLGSLQKNNIFHIWNNDRYVNLRKKLAKGKIDEIALCSKCPIAYE